MTLGLPVGAVMNCADNSGAKSEWAQRPDATYPTWSVKRIHAEDDGREDGCH